MYTLYSHCTAYKEKISLLCDFRLRQCLRGILIPHPHQTDVLNKNCPGYSREAEYRTLDLQTLHWGGKQKNRADKRRSPALQSVHGGGGPAKHGEQSSAVMRPAGWSVTRDICTKVRPTPLQVRSSRHVELGQSAQRTLKTHWEKR